jgi:hypothetical protein
MAESGQLSFFRTLLTKQFGIAVMLGTCIWEVLSSNLGQDISYSDDFHSFPQSPQANAGILP